MKLLFWRKLSDLHSSISCKYVYVSISIYKIRVNTELEKQAGFPDSLWGLCGMVLVLGGPTGASSVRIFQKLLPCQMMSVPASSKTGPLLVKAGPSAMVGAPL